MGNKPFLILELDSHVADAGLDTRIEAFLDMFDNFKKLKGKKRFPWPTVGGKKRKSSLRRPATGFCGQQREDLCVEPSAGPSRFPVHGALASHDLVAATFPIHRAFGLRRCLPQTTRS
jgi:hypothetical protein